MPPRLRWRASSAPSPVMPRTARRCCGSSATIAARPMALDPPSPPLGGERVGVRWGEAVLRPAGGAAPPLTPPIAHATGPPPLPPEGGEGDSYEGLSILPVPLDVENCPDPALAAA